MATSRTHMTELPPGFLVLRVLQLLASVAILGLSLFCTLTYPSVGSILGLTTAIVTTIVLIWVITATRCAPSAYNYWAVLAMEIFLFLMWIDSFSWFITEALYYSNYYSYYNSCGYTYNSTTSSYEDTCSEGYNSFDATRISLFVAAGLSGCMSVFYLTSLIIVSIGITKHRAAGGHNTIGSAPPGPYLPHPGQANVYHQYQPNMQTPYLLQQLPMTQQDVDLRQQNIALQQQYLALQQEHLALQRQSKIGGGSESVVSTTYGDGAQK